MSRRSGPGSPIKDMRQRGIFSAFRAPADDEVIREVWDALQAPGGGSVRELVRTNDAVLLSAIQALLQAARIPHLVFDQNMSVLEGSLGILPRRILVAEAYAPAARRLLEQAGFAHELRPDVP